MAPQFQVNINISAGVDFNQEFVIQNPDGSPVVITECSFAANLAKHPTAIDAMVSTSGTPVHTYVPFTASVVDGVGGKYSIALSSAQTSKLEEGKYVYNVVMTDVNGDTQSMMSGLAFVDVAFGSVS